MVSCTTRNDTFPLLLGIQLLHHVESSPQLEAEYRLKIFSFEQDLTASLGRKIDTGLERRLLDKIVDIGIEDETEVVGCVIGLHQVRWEVGVEVCRWRVLLGGSRGHGGVTS